MSMLTRAGLPCNECGSHDAMAEYDNGTFCFSCHHTNYFNYNKSKVVFNKDPKVIETPFQTCGIKENSFIHCFLKERHFTEDLLRYYKLEQSVDDNYLILTGYENEIRKFIEIRLMNSKIIGPKYRTIGTKKQWFRGAMEFKVLPRHLVIVEDMLSAMRVGWVVPCIALRGTSLSEEVTAKFCEFNKDLNIFTWFDSDLPGQSAAKAFKDKLNWAGFSFKNIITAKDPKMYSDDEIRSVLSQGGYNDV